MTAILLREVFSDHAASARTTAKVAQLSREATIQADINIRLANEDLHGRIDPDAPREGSSTSEASSKKTG
jgi:hypothetical protein